jgi:ubiquinone/menaquinone biosynthesis C-methylase UbiE
MGWKSIWARRQPSHTRPLTLAELIALDGFDGPRTISENVWTRRVYDFMRQTKLNRRHNICEVGCGGGAFLFPLYKKGYTKVAGIDFSARLVKICRNVMPLGNFMVSDACFLPFKAYSFDVVVCNSVWQYFPDLDHAREALREILRVLKPRSHGAILNVPNAQKKNTYLRRLKHELGEREFDRLYKNDQHLFYDPKWMGSIAKEYNLAYTISSDVIPGYIGSSLRFSFYFETPQIARSER